MDPFWTSSLAVYLLGVLTVPFFIGLFLLQFYLFLPRHGASSASAAHQKDADDWRGEDVFASSDFDDIRDKLADRNSETDVAAGYFAVCREYVPGGLNGKPPERTTPAGEVIAAESPSVYQSMYRTIFDRNKTPSTELGRNTKRARNIFYVVLRYVYCCWCGVRSSGMC